jgi:cobalt-zinc-cadmium efflux system protein
MAHPSEVFGLQMLVIALIGLLVNLVSILILHGSHRTDLNVKGVFYHMVADAASSLGIVLAALVIFYTGWNIVDPLVALAISVLIIYWAWGILRESAVILLEMAPSGLDVDTMGHDLKEHFPEIEELENVHLWIIIPDMLVFSAHLRLGNASTTDQQELIKSVSRYLSEEYGIIESTLQVGR